MQRNVVLCADRISLENPSLIGLEGECLTNQPWLKTFSNAFEAREYLRFDHTTQEVWVASSDAMDPINLAAALKRDSAEKQICLLAFEGSGSLKSRAHAARIDEALSQKGFVSRYTQRKNEGKAALCRKPETTGVAAPNVLPGQEASLQGPVRGGRPTPAGARPVSPKPTHVFPIVSASGGTGKSTIATLTSFFAQGFGYRTVLVDADLQFGDMRYLLGDEQAPGLDDVIREPPRIARLHPNGLVPAFIAAPRRVEQSEEIAPHIPSLIENLKTQFDVIVINTGAFWTEQHLMLLESSSAALFILDQRPSSLRGCKQLLELCSRCGIATRSFSFVLNRCARNAPLTSIDVSCALQGARVMELHEGGREVEELLDAGMPLALIEARNTLCLSVEEMLITLLPKQDADQKGSSRPALSEKRFRFNRKRRKVACL